MYAETHDRAICHRALTASAVAAPCHTIRIAACWSPISYSCLSLLSALRLHRRAAEPDPTRHPLVEGQHPHALAVERRQRLSGDDRRLVRPARLQLSRPLRSQRPQPGRPLDEASTRSRSAATKTHSKNTAHGLATTGSKPAARRARPITKSASSRSMSFASSSRSRASSS